MIKNNFDKSSTSTNIELDIRRDLYLARINFNENVRTLSSTELYVYTQNDILDKDWEREYKLQKRATNLTFLKRLFKNEYITLTINNLKDFKSYLEVDTDAEINDLDFETIVAEVFAYYYDDDEYHSYMQLNAAANFQVIHISGDNECAEVLIPSEFVEHITREYINNLFYDAPICGLITINGSEYYADEYLKDYYVWDKEEFLESFFKAENFSKYAEKFISENTPEFLEYT